VSEVRLFGQPSIHDDGDPVKAGRGDRLARILLLPLIILLLTLIAVFYVFFDFSQVAGPSMVPTLLDGDRLLLTKGYSSPRHGDIVVFIIDEQGKPTEIVKRVVGLPGDTIEVFGDRAAVNGKPEATPHTGIVKSDQPHIAPQVVPAGNVFVMGDNRPVSLDSRYIGPLPLTAAHGRVAAIWAPVGRMRVVPSGLD
jgi:signal peptidase I